MFIDQTPSMSRFNYLHLGEGYFAKVGCSKKFCQKKDFDLKPGYFSVVQRWQIHFGRDLGGYSVTRKIFRTERFSRQTTVHAFLTYVFNYD
jgi:hypothetical protein